MLMTYSQWPSLHECGIVAHSVIDKYKDNDEKHGEVGNTLARIKVPLSVYTCDRISNTLFFYSIPGSISYIIIAVKMLTVKASQFVIVAPAQSDLSNS